MPVLIVLLIVAALILSSVVLCVLLYFILHTESIILKFSFLFLWIILVGGFVHVDWFYVFPMIEKLIKIPV